MVATTEIIGPDGYAKLWTVGHAGWGRVKKRELSGNVVLLICTKSGKCPTGKKIIRKNLGILGTFPTRNSSASGKEEPDQELDATVRKSSRISNTRECKGKHMAL